MKYNLFTKIWPLLIGIVTINTTHVYGAEKPAATKLTASQRLQKVSTFLQKSSSYTPEELGLHAHPFLENLSQLNNTCTSSADPILFPAFQRTLKKHKPVFTEAFEKALYHTEQLLEPRDAQQYSLCYLDIIQNTYTDNLKKDPIPLTIEKHLPLGKRLTLFLNRKGNNPAKWSQNNGDYAIECIASIKQIIGEVALTKDLLTTYHYKDLLTTYHSYLQHIHNVSENTTLLIQKIKTYQENILSVTERITGSQLDFQFANQIKCIREKYNEVAKKFGLTQLAAGEQITEKTLPKSTNSEEQQQLLPVTSQQNDTPITYSCIGTESLIDSQDTATSQTSASQMKDLSAPLVATLLPDDELNTKRKILQDNINELNEKIATSYTKKNLAPILEDINNNIAIASPIHIWKKDRLYTKIGYQPESNPEAMLSMLRQCYWYPGPLKSTTIKKFQPSGPNDLTDAILRINKFFMNGCPNIQTEQFILDVIALNNLQLNILQHTTRHDKCRVAIVKNEYFQDICSFIKNGFDFTEKDKFVKAFNNLNNKFNPQPSVFYALYKSIINSSAANNFWKVIQLFKFWQWHRFW